MLFFKHIEHFHGCFDGRFSLVGIQCPCTNLPVAVSPCDDRLDEGIRSTTRRDGYGVVLKDGESSIEIGSVNFPESLHEGIVLSVARGVGLISASIDFHLHISERFQSVCGSDKITDEFHLLCGYSMFEHITDDEGEVVLGDDFLPVAQFGDTLCHLLALFGREHYAQFFEVAFNIGFTTVFSQRILPFTSESFRHQFITIEIRFRVAIGMHPCHLCKHILADDGLIWRHSDATIPLDQSTDIIEFLFVDIRLCMEKVLHNNLDAGQRCISASFAQSVDRHVQSPCPTEHRSQRVRHCQVVVIVPVEIEVHLRISFFHFSEILNHLQRVQHP